MLNKLLYVHIIILPNVVVDALQFLVIQFSELTLQL